MSGSILNVLICAAVLVPAQSLPLHFDAQANRHLGKQTEWEHDELSDESSLMQNSLEVIKAPKTTRTTGTAANATSEALRMIDLGLRTKTIPYREDRHFRSVRPLGEGEFFGLLLPGSLAHVCWFVLPLLFINYVITVLVLGHTPLAHVGTFVFFILLSAICNAREWVLFGQHQGESWTLGWLMEWPLTMELILVYFLVVKNHKVPEDQVHKAVTLGLYLSLAVRAILILIIGALPFARAWLMALKAALLWLCGVSFLAKKGPEAFDLEDWFWVQQVFQGKLVYKDDASVLVYECGKLPFTRLAFTVVTMFTWELFFSLCHTASKGWYVDDPFVNLTSTVLSTLTLRAFFFVLNDIKNCLRMNDIVMAFIILALGVEVLINIFVETKLWTPLAVFIIGFAIGTIVTKILAAMGVKEVKEEPVPAG